MDEVIYKTDLICETNNINQQRDVNTIQTLREIDRNIMSWSDTVHYQDNPIIANHCQGEIITDLQGNNYIDTQMWHSSCNFGYRNMQIENAVRHQLDQLPQVSGDFLHVDKLLPVSYTDLWSFDEINAVKCTERLLPLPRGRLGGGHSCLNWCRSVL